MPVRRSVLPEVGKVQPCRVQFVPVASIVLYLASAVPTSGNGDPNLVEGLRLAPGVIQEGVMCGVKASPSAVCAFHGYCYPVPEVQPLVHKPGESDGQFRESVKEKGSTGFQDPGAFMYPLLTPCVILDFLNLVVEPVLVVLAKIKRRVRKNGINSFGIHRGKNIEAVTTKKNTVSSRKVRFIHPSKLY